MEAINSGINVGIYCFNWCNLIALSIYDCVWSEKIWWMVLNQSERVY